MQEVTKLSHAQRTNSSQAQRVSYAIDSIPDVSEGDMNESVGPVSLSVIIPCYKSSSMIEGVISRLVSTIRSHERAIPYEIILVDDSSGDGTYKVLRNLALSNQQIIALELSKNFGQHAALMAGMSKAKGEIIVCMDDDGQTPPESLFDLIGALDDDHDLVYAKYPNKQHNRFRNFGSKINDLMAIKLLGKPKDLYISSYFAAKRYLIEEALRYPNPYPYMQGLMLRSTDRICNVMVPHNERSEGQSGYTLRKLLSLWLNGFTAFSVKPLRIASFIGILFALVGFLFALFVVIRRLLDPNMALGWSSTTALMLIIGGLILTTLGIVGEYVGRSYISLNNAPQYVIRESVEHTDDSIDHIKNA